MDDFRRQYENFTSDKGNPIVVDFPNRYFCYKGLSLLRWIYNTQVLSELQVLTNINLEDIEQAEIDIRNQYFSYDTNWRIFCPYKQDEHGWGYCNSTIVTNP